MGICSNAASVKVIPNNSKLRSQQRKHRGEKIYQCESCRHTYAMEKELRRHIRRLHYIRHLFKSSMCECNFKQQLKPRSQKCKHREEKLYLCESCHHTYAMETELKTHIRKLLHNRYLYKCGKCGSNFNQHKKLSYHMHKYIEEKSCHSFMNSCRNSNYWKVPCR